jgi:uncharacterized protein (TIGR02231 family)
MSSHQPSPFRFKCAATLASLLAFPALETAHAQSAPGAPNPAVESRITQVKVYPGSATVERTARVGAGSKSFTFHCLPAGLEVQSLQVSAGAAVRLGETFVLTEDRALSARCSGSPLDSRIRDLEDQKDAMQAEVDALSLVTGYLKGLAGMGATEADVAGNKRGAVLDAKGITGVTETMRRTGQDALLKQRQIARRQADVDKLLNPLLAERARTQGAGAGNKVIAVTVTLVASADADVKLSYQVNGPGWTPSYRALLDTSTRKLRIERLALVAQATGEDWRGVKLLLSTGQPRRETEGRLPAPWRIGVEPTQPRAERGRDASLQHMAAPMAAPAPAAMSKMDSQEPLFETMVFNNAFATEFSVPQAIDVPSNGQRVSMALGQVEDTAMLTARISPSLDASAFLVADISHPSGVWPAGPMQLYRDGAFVGQGRWDASGGTRLSLSFGRDELVRVEVEPERDNQGTGGFVGSRAERKVQRAYVIDNRHTMPISAQVLEAAPVSVDEQVRIATQFNPQPTELAWNKRPGVAMWALELGAGKTARLAADYMITYPKEVRLQER